MIIDEAFKSLIWDSERHYKVIVPEGYHESNTRYPVLYLLHGVNQNFQSWTKYTFLEVLAEQYPFIMAIPDGDDSWYLNFNDGIAHQCAYILEFVAHIDSNYRTLTDRCYRGVSGISMGGYASVLVGLIKPEIFGSVSALSGVLDITNHWNGDLKLSEVVCKSQSAVRCFHLFDLAKNSNGIMVHLLFDSGTEDTISFEDSCNFNRILNNLNIPHIFNQYSGEHDWYYWDAHLQEHLDFHRQCFGKKVGEK